MLGHYTTAPLFARLCFHFTLTRVIRIIANFLAPVKPFRQPIFNLLPFFLKITRRCSSSYPPIDPANWIASAPITYNKKIKQYNFFGYIWEVSVKRSISRPLVGLPSPSSDLSTEGTIICVICQAAYAPSRLHSYLLQTPPIALESAFMSMCHFCFRCRRPSCPNCWDSVHSICGQCTRETHVPFRTPTPPLAGMTLPSTPAHYSADEHSLPSSLISIHPGRFQEFSPSLTNTTSNYSPQTHFPTQSAGTVVPSSSIDIDAVATRPDHNVSLDIDAIATRPDRSRFLDIDAVATRPDPGRSHHTDKIKTRPDHFRSGKQKLIRLLITSILLLIVLLLAIIVASLLWGDVNLSIYHLLHIDIRAEITIILHFFHGLF
jgi:hypothetical protein